MTINCYEVRRHLAYAHHIDLRGLDYGELVAIHTQEHEAVQGHHHDDDGAPHGKLADA